MEPFSAYDNGLGFFNAFKTLLKKTSLDALSKSKSYTDATMIMPTVVNGALACELLLKALIQDETKSHHIIELIDRLENKDPGMKGNIQSICIALIRQEKGRPDYDSLQYEEDLQRMDNAFVNLRYWHESRGNANTTELVCDLGFLDVFACVLLSLCETKFGPRPKTQT